MQSFWQKLFSIKLKPVVQQVKQRQKFVAVEPTQVMVDIVSQLTTFFRLQEQLAAHIRAEDDKSKNVYDPDANLMEAALKRVMALDQMAELEKDIRETMVYQSPPEMGALYSKVFSMREIISLEQEGARLKQEAKDRYKAWQRAEANRNFREKSAYIVATLVFLVYLWLWLILLNREART